MSRSNPSGLGGGRGVRGPAGDELAYRAAVDAWLTRMHAVTIALGGHPRNTYGPEWELALTMVPHPK